QDRRGKTWRIGAVFAACGALAFSGCTSKTESPAPTTSTSAATVEKVDAIANTVPENIKSTGKLVVGVNIPYTPNEFKDPDGKIVGFDVDLMNATASVLGLTTECEKTVDFVDYFSAGILWAQRPGAGIDPNNACGKKVAVQATTTEETWELPAKSKACTDTGKPPIEIVPFDSQDAANNAVLLGQADAMSADSPVTFYAIKQSNGKLEEAGETFDSAPYGWPVAKGSPLAQSLLQALQHLIDTGTYKQIATNWYVEKGMIDKPVINGA